MALFRGRLLSNQDVPDIERKHGKKTLLGCSFFETILLRKRQTGALDGE
jgi:hypothetical protein